MGSTFLKTVIEVTQIHLMEISMTQLNEADIARVLERFYASVREDDELAPVFAVVHDWDEHLTRLAEFWSSMMLATGSYKGNPLSMHLAHADKFRPELFTRWLEIWTRTTNELLPLSIASEMQARARRIASRFSLIICGKDIPGDARIAPPTAATVPYRTSALFDEITLPRALLADHALKSGTWAVVRVEQGSVGYRQKGDKDPTTLGPGNPGIIPPEIPHSLELVGPVQLRVEFYDRQPLA
jgi:truncated hemoglobin YjbI/tellurite resistance-related uncharacterized protein